MNPITNLVSVSASFGAGAAILESARQLRRTGMHEAADVLMMQYDTILAHGREHAIESAAGFSALAHGDILREAFRDEQPTPAKLPKTWPFPKNAEEALI